MRLDSQHKKILTELAEKYDVPIEEIDTIRKSPFKLIRTVLKNTDYSNIKTEEEFNKMVKNFNIPYIGKLHAKYTILKNIHKNIEYKENKINKL